MGTASHARSMGRATGSGRSSPAAAPARPKQDDERAVRTRGRWAILLLLAVCSGVAFALHVRSARWALLAYVSTVPWVLMACHPRLRGRGDLASFLLAVGIGWYAGLTWLRHYALAAWLVAPLLYFPFTLAAFWLVRRIRDRRPAIPLALLWPVVLTGIDWFRVRVTPGELGVCLLGYSQVGIAKLVQVADVGGVWAVSFVIAAISGLIADAVIRLTSGRGDSAAGRPWRERLSPLLPSAAAVAILVATVLVYGFLRDTERHFSPGPTLHVVQPNLAHSSDLERTIAVLRSEVKMTLDTARPGEVDAVIWPENSLIAILLFRGEGLNPRWSTLLNELAQRLRAPVLVDGGSEDLTTRDEYRTTVLMSPDGSWQSYDKCALLPWTEYVPFRSQLDRMSDGAGKAWAGVVASVVGFTPGARHGDPALLRPMALVARDGLTYRFGTPLCFELGVPRIVNRWHRHGVDFLVNPTSEGALGDTVHDQTLAVAAFRAIEGRVSVVRAANDGISVLIDPNGRVKDVLRGNRTGALVREAGVFFPQVILDSRSHPTIYARFGDWLPIACLMLAGLLALRRRG